MREDFKKMSEDYYFSEYDTELSNLFYDRSGLFHIGEVPFTSVEHAYQYFRFMPKNADTDHKEFANSLLRISNPEEVRKAAVKGINEKKITQRTDWEDLRDDVMLQCLRAKFIQDLDCRKALMETDPARLHLTTHAVEEDETEEFYWGAGTHSFGKDRLGSTLMLVREELKMNYFNNK